MQNSWASCGFSRASPTKSAGWRSGAIGQTARTPPATRYTPAIVLQGVCSGHASTIGLGTCYNGFSQYLVEFPEGATQNQRLLLLAAFISTDLEFFDNNQ